MKSFDIQAAIDELKIQGSPIRPCGIQVQIADARAKMYHALRHILQIEKPKWIPEYDKVAEWLSNSEGKNLLIYGSCGTGKTVLTRYVIPAILLADMRKVVKSYDMQQLNNNVDEAVNVPIISLDDIGTEEPSIIFGRRRDAVAEIIDNAEKYNRLVLMSSNLDSEAIKARYGERIMDRIRGIFVRIPINHQSFRG